ncbi:uncharacterized protein [Anabrus simplex]|uniref:uncharacterized protein n=1 Tax=Anabrus simplex TaxID=316456 RepID=UPI0035A2D0BD
MSKGYAASVAVLISAMYIITSVSGGKYDHQRLTTARQVKTARRIPQPRNDLDNIIVKALEVLRGLMPKGISELGVPVLEPFRLSHHGLNIQSELATISGSLDDLTIANLSTFRLKHISSDIENLKEDFVFSFGRITVSGLYNITGEMIDSVSVFGNGAFSLIVDGLMVGGRVRLARENGTDNNPAKIDELLIRFSIKAMQSNSENFMGGGEMGDLMNNVVSESAPQFIHQHQEELSSLLATAMQDLLNPLLEQYTIKQILDLLDVRQTMKN